MFEKKSSESPEREARGPASDRFGIMEKLKRLQDGEDLDELLAEINEELPSEEEDEDADPYLTNVQKRVSHKGWGYCLFIVGYRFSHRSHGVDNILTRHKLFK
jgi:hypothetical protein